MNVRLTWVYNNSHKKVALCALAVASNEVCGSFRIKRYDKLMHKKFYNMYKLRLFDFCLQTINNLYFDNLSKNNEFYCREIFNYLVGINNVKIAAHTALKDNWDLPYGFTEHGWVDNRSRFDEKFYLS